MKEELTTMPETTISAAGMRIVKLLVGNPPQTVADLIEATQVTRTAVMEQLNELVDSGFVERSTERLAGRGRPRYLFKATNAAMLLLFTGRQQRIVPAIWRAIHELGGQELTHKVLQRVTQQIASHYCSQITAKKPEDRLLQFVDLLTAEGGLIDAVTDDDGRILIYRRSCPFANMVDDQRSVCSIDLEMLSTVVGRPVRRIQCRHEGAPCCQFEVVQ